MTRVLVVNAGSSSLKLQVLGPGDEVEAERHVQGWDGHDTRPIAELVGDDHGIEAVGHRVVHSGVELREAQVLDDAVVKRLRSLSSLAPLHQGATIAGITAAQAVVPDVPHVACFDTSYHATIPAAAATYALPAVWRSRWPLRRFGFHGLSHAYAARRGAELVGRQGDSDLRLVSCHLGSGASLCASLGEVSVDTTMGFTPLEGLVMSTRAGSVDPGLVLWLITEARLAPDVVNRALERSSGLVGLAGTPDMRQVLSKLRAGDEDARLAFDVYSLVLAKQVAAMTASLRGIDVLVFTGGVGEHSPEVRAEAANRLGYLGVAVDPGRNAAARGGDEGPDHDVSTAGAPVRTLVIASREDLEIARQTRAALGWR